MCIYKDSKMLDIGNENILPIGLTHICQKLCKNCSLTVLLKLRLEKLAKECALSVINKTLKKYKSKRNLTYIIYGCSLHSFDILDTVLYYINKKSNIVLVINAYNFHISKVLASKIKIVDIIAPHYDYDTSLKLNCVINDKGDEASFINNIKKLIKGGKQVNITCKLNNYLNSVDKMYKLIYYFKDMGVKHINFISNENILDKLIDEFNEIYMTANTQLPPNKIYDNNIIKIGDIYIKTSKLKAKEDRCDITYLDRYGNIMTKDFLDI